MIGDLLSLLRTIAIPALLAAAVAVGTVAIVGGGRLGAYALVLLWGIIGLVAFVVVAGVVATAVTLPSVSAIADRQPPERSSWKLTEVLKVVCVVLTAAMIPSAFGMVEQALSASHKGDIWAATGDAVALRTSSGSAEQLGEDIPDLAGLAFAAESQIALSVPLTEGGVDIVGPQAYNALVDAGFDGIAIVNDGYIDMLSSYLGLTPSESAPLGVFGRAISLDEVPSPIRDALTANLDLWTSHDDGFRNLDLYAYSGSTPFPVLASPSGLLSVFDTPLILYASDAPAIFDADFIGSLITSGQVVFADDAWLKRTAEQHGLSEIVLSVDRIADRGRAAAQRQRQTAELATISLGLVILSLSVMLALSAWIFALARQQRIFVERSAGSRWVRILRGRIVWEATVLTATATSLTVALAMSGNPHAWAALGVLPLYALLSTTLHRWSVLKVFAATVSRRS